MGFINSLQTSDKISRSVIQPRHYEFGRLKLDTFAFDNTNRKESVNCHRFFKVDSDAHQLGQNLVTFQNARLQREGKEPNRIYRGYIESIVEKVKEIKIENIYLDVNHCPENDNHAHCEIHLKTIDEAKPKPKKMFKEFIQDKLLRVFSSLIKNES